MTWHLNKIPKILHLYWGGDQISFMRFLTVHSFRKFNPDWVIKIHRPVNVFSGDNTWLTGEQSGSFGGVDYSNNLNNYGVEFVDHDFTQYGFSNDLPETYKSDFLRWILLHTDGGVYSDFDIIYTKPMDNLLENVPSNSNVDVCLCKYINVTRHAIGFLMGAPDNDFFKHISEKSKVCLDTLDYQSIGSKLFNKDYQTVEDVKIKHPNTNPIFLHESCVYSINSFNIPYFYNESVEVNAYGSIGFHWYAGDSLSTKFEYEINHNNYMRYKNTIGNIIRLSI